MRQNPTPEVLRGIIKPHIKRAQYTGLWTCSYAPPKLEEQDMRNHRDCIKFAGLLNAKEREELRGKRGTSK